MKPLKNRSFSLISLLVCLLALLAATVNARAQVVTNTFPNPSLDLVANGVLGSGFDGVVLNSSDIPGGSGAGTTLMAQSGYNYPLFSVQNLNGGWSGSEDDGFFAYNVVWGDFDAYLDVAAPYPLNVAYVFGGLMARAISDGTGQPFNPTGTNASENWLKISRFEQYGIPTQVRYATNSVDHQITVNNLYGGVDDTTADVFLRLTRTGDTFNFYDSKTQGGPWTLERTITMTNLHGAAMQVGIEEGPFTPNTPIVFFSQFGVVGTNTITPPANDPTNILVSAPLSPTSLTVSWTPAPGSDGSIVVLSKANQPILQSPAYGFSYVGNSTNGSVINMGGQQQAVYVGSGSSVTLRGLGGSNNVYNLAVYSFTTNNGTTPITYDSNPATTNFNGPGTLASVTFVTAPNTIPVNGVGLAIVTACYTSGDCYNVSTNPDVSLSSDNTAVLQINGEVMNGLAVGTANVTLTFNGVTSAPKAVSVHNPVFTDNFGVLHDYVTNGLMGTSWDGAYLNFGDVPGAQGFAGAGFGQTLVLTANTNILALEAAGSSWEGVGDDGPFLFKIVTGDFQASVHVTNMNNINFNVAGLMARLFDNSGSATQGAAGGSGGETHVTWWKVQAGALSFRYTLDGGTNGAQPGLVASDTWLLLQRLDSTNFYFYEMSAPGALWSLAGMYVVPEAANNAPMEVGIAEQMNTGSDGTVKFDTFMLDGVGIASPTGVQPPPPASGLTMTLNNDLTFTLNWIAQSNGLPIQSMVVMRAGAPVSAQPPYGYLFNNGAYPFGAGSDLGDGNYVVYRSPGSPSSINNSTVVTGLTPGTTYYAAVYTWVGSSTSKMFDDVIPATGASATLLDGILTNVVVLTPPTIPAGGIGQLKVLGYYQGGAIANVSQFATLTSGDTTVVDTADGVITGYANGTTTVKVVYSGFTNTVNVVVRSSTYQDNFTTPHDYLTNGVAGTFFDGIYTNFGDIPEQNSATTGNNSTDVTLDADAGITMAGVLTITNYGSGWEYAADDGFFLFKYVPADFQMAVHITNYSTTVNYTIPSIMARAYSVSTNGPAPNTGTIFGAPLDGVGGECYVRMARFDEYGIGTYPEITIDDNSVQATQPGQGDGQNWLLLVRQNYTNFNVYQRLTNNQPWHLTPNKTSFSDPHFAGQPMQVGLTLSIFNGVNGFVQFDSFMLDAAQGQGPTLKVSSAGGFVTITWPYYPGAVLQSSITLDPADWHTVSTPLPTYANGVAQVTLPIGAGNLFLRLTEPAP
jgi:hypothetical protein